jgi:hypothetical protein
LLLPPSSSSLALVAVAHPRRPHPLCCRCHRPCHPLLHHCCRRSPNTLVPVALAILTLFAAALIRRALSLFVVARHCAHVHRPHFPLPSQVDCCLFTPLAAGGGLGASSAPPIQQTRPTPPRRCSKNESSGLRSCGHRDGYPCACERPSLSITRARDVHEWGSTGEWWEDGDDVVWRISVISAMVVM